MVPTTPSPPLALRLDLKRQDPSPVPEPASDAERTVRYAGTVEIEGASHAIDVRVAPSDRAADGLSATATAPELPEPLQERIQMLVASMARKAVRAANKDDLTPPHRIRRWRSVQP